MSEIYWIQRIGALSEFFGIILAVGVFVIAIALIACIVFAEDETTASKAKSYAKISFVAIVIGALGDIFTPSTKEMYAIYGIGGTIDYIKSNDKAKELPDKVVNALTRYVDNIEKEDKDNNNN